MRRGRVSRVEGRGERLVERVGDEERCERQWAKE